MIKYDIIFCHCGKIHAIPHSDYDWMEDGYENKEIIHVCQNCGVTRRIFFDEYFEGGLAFCSSDVQDDEVIDTEDGKIRRIRFSRGYYVPLVNDLDEDKDDFPCTEYANSYFSGSFFPAGGEKRDVDVKKLAREINNDEIYEAIKGYYPFWKYFKEESNETLA